MHAPSLGCCVTCQSLIHFEPSVSLHDGCYSHTSSETTRDAGERIVQRSIDLTEAEQQERPVKSDNCALTVTLPPFLFLPIFLLPSYFLVWVS